MTHDKTKFIFSNENQQCGVAGRGYQEDRYSITPSLLKYLQACQTAPVI